MKSRSCEKQQNIQTSSVSIQHYVDGAASDNLPRCCTKNTVTISAYAGESDLCPPRGNKLSFHQIRFNNVSIQVNAENMYRVTSTFFPPEQQVSYVMTFSSAQFNPRSSNVASASLFNLY